MDGKATPHRLLRRAGVRANLYPYQIAGMHWWLRREQARHQVGGVLADDKGLGKTAQCIAAVLMADEHERVRVDVPATARSPQEAMPTLVVCPLAVLHQWREEIRVHTTLDADRQVVIYHGAEAARRRVTVAGMQRDDVRFVLTTFDTVRSEASASEVLVGLGISRAGVGTAHGLLHRVTWRRIVLDEADRIRNATTSTAKAVRALRAPRRFAMTGTPINNAASDIHSLAAFVGVPPYDSPDWWSKAPAAAQQAWRSRFVLRRLKEEVLTLPPVQRDKMILPLTGDERRVYEALEREACLYFESSAAAAATKDRGDGKNAAATDIREVQKLLEWLLRLRQAACHPQLVTNSAATAIAKKRRCAGGCGRQRPPDGVPMLRPWSVPATFAAGGRDAGDTKMPTCTHPMCSACVDASVACVCCSSSSATGGVRSAKQRALVDALRDHFRADATAKALVFSQWTSWLDLVQADLLAHGGYKTLRIDGSVTGTERAAVVKQFQEDESPTAARVLVATLKSGGVGLNLTRASLVVFMDSWYNPACESQAMDRILRIGQTRPVRVLRLLTDTLVERVIDGMQSSKLRVAASFLGDAEDTDVPAATAEEDDDAPRMSLLTQTFAMISAGRRSATNTPASSSSSSSSSITAMDIDDAIESPSGFKD